LWSTPSWIADLFPKKVEDENRIMRARKQAWQLGERYPRNQQALSGANDLFSLFCGFEDSKSRTPREALLIRQL